MLDWSARLHTAWDRDNVFYFIKYCVSIILFKWCVINNTIKQVSNREDFLIVGHEKSEVGKVPLKLVFGVFLSQNMLAVGNLELHRYLLEDEFSNSFV